MDPLLIAFRARALIVALFFRNTIAVPLIAFSAPRFKKDWSRKDDDPPIIALLTDALRMLLS